MSHMSELHFDLCDVMRNAGCYDQGNMQSAMAYAVKRELEDRFHFSPTQADEFAASMVQDYEELSY